jgi:hypothetical protein
MFIGVWVGEQFCNIVDTINTLMEAQIGGCVCGDALCILVIIPHAHAFLVQFFLGHDLVFFFCFLFWLAAHVSFIDPTYKGETTKQTM